MRVPIPVVILLVLTVVGGMWWKNTRHMDFTTPPSEARLLEIRQSVESSFSQASHVEPIAVPVVEPPPPPPPPPEPPKPVVDLGDLTTPPTLQSYGEISQQGTDHLIELATALEEKGEFQRALLAWERVLDLTKPDGVQSATAISAIKRLRPTLPDWNTKPETAIQISLQAGTGKKLAKTLTPILEGVAHDLERASAGIVKIKASVTPGKTSKTPAPVAVWLTGPGKKPVSTDVLSFTVESPEKLQEEIYKTVFQLVRAYLSKSTAYTAPTELGAGENPMEALTFRITRLSWSEFATSLTVPPKTTPPKKGG